MREFRVGSPQIVWGKSLRPISACLRSSQLSCANVMRRLMLAALLEGHAERMGQLLDKALTTIERALQATKQIRSLGWSRVRSTGSPHTSRGCRPFVRLLATGPYSYRSAGGAPLSLSTEVDGRTVQNAAVTQTSGAIPRMLRGRGHYKVQVESFACSFASLTNCGRTQPPRLVSTRA
jgi:hypothetical protein